MYWRLEREICSGMARAASGKLGTDASPGFTLEQAHTASAAKSFDYRVGIMTLASPFTTTQA